MTEYLRPFQKELEEQVQMARMEVAETGVSKGIVLIGGSGTGKTHAFDYLSGLFSNSNEGHQVTTPCIRVSLKTSPDAISVSKSALSQLGRPTKSKTTLDELEELLHDAIRTRKTSVVMLEEYHNALLANESAIRTKNRRFLKNLWNLHNPKSNSSFVSERNGEMPRGIVLVLSATEELLKPLKEDVELQSRFTSYIFAPELALFPPALLDEYRHVLKFMLKRYGLSEKISVNDREFVAKTFFASNGHLRQLNDLIQRARTLSRKYDTSKTIVELLSTAFDQVGAGEKDRTKNPFTWSSEELMTNVAKAQLKLQQKPQGKNL